MAEWVGVLVAADDCPRASETTSSSKYVRCGLQRRAPYGVDADEEIQLLAGVETKLLKFQNSYIFSENLSISGQTL